MPVNRYFNNFPSRHTAYNEHAVLEDIVAESIEIMGHDVYYILRESLDEIDYIFGEFPKVKMKHAYLIEAYLANVEGFEGDGDFFSKFGLEIRDTTNFVISRRSFVRNVPTTLRERPREGDLVYVPLMHRIFEIKFIEKRLMFYSLGNREPYIYEMRAEEFRYSQEKIETGIDAIDEVEEDNAYTQRLQLATTGVGSFIEGEKLWQGANLAYATATATVKEWFAANGTMYVYSIAGEFAANSNVHSETTHSIYNVVSIDDERTDYVDQDLYNNKDLHDDNTIIIDASELNPIGNIF